MYINVYYFLLLLIVTAGIFYTLPKQIWMIQLLVALGWVAGLIYLLLILFATPVKIFIQITQLV